VPESLANAYEKRGKTIVSLPFRKLIPGVNKPEIHWPPTFWHYFGNPIQMMMEEMRTKAIALGCNSRG